MLNNLPIIALLFLIQNSEISQRRMETEELENVDPESEISGKKKKKRVKKVRRKRVKNITDTEEPEPNEEDEQRLKAFQEGARSAKRNSSMSLEVEKMAQGKTLTHFQVSVL